MRRLIYSGKVPTKVVRYDHLVIGSGIAGLYCALHLDKTKKTLVISKTNIDKSNSWLAQGGIASVISKEDRSEFHVEDTLKAGAGLCKLEAVKVLVAEGPENIKELQHMNVPFDTDGEGELQITREGGHRLRRIVHCGGDATGRETTKKLGEIVLEEKNIDVSFDTYLVDILTDEDGACGVIAYNKPEECYIVILSSNIIVATGGIGQLFKYTSNPIGAIGDGIACAMRAGAVVSNMEMIQFHPTMLKPDEKTDRLFLISEAVRGEGGILRNKAGEAFMQGKHEMADLAPRDIVTREIIKELNRTGDECAFLDVSKMSREFFSKRFPTIFAECTRHNIHLTDDYIPVRPAQHYLMGGIETDLDGQTAVRGLFAAGEAANTGIHGGNRLASNSVLECLVFGRRCAQKINADFRPVKDVDLSAILESRIPLTEISSEKALADRLAIKDTMTKYLGAVRTLSGMEKALSRLYDICAEYEYAKLDTIDKIEVENMARVAFKSVENALMRRESVGAHYVVPDDEA